MLTSREKLNTRPTFVLWERWRGKPSPVPKMPGLPWKERAALRMMSSAALCCVSSCYLSYLCFLCSLDLSNPTCSSTWKQQSCCHIFAGMLQEVGVFPWMRCAWSPSDKSWFLREVTGGAARLPCSSLRSTYQPCPGFNACPSAGKSHRQLCLWAAPAVPSATVMICSIY